MRTIPQVALIRPWLFLFTAACLPDLPPFQATDLDDTDGDGYIADDCDDTRADIHPLALEICNHIDENCNGKIDESAIDASTWYIDVDGDGRGDEDGPAIIACTAPNMGVRDHSDCNDSNPFLPDTFYPDGDGDGFGDATFAGIFTCSLPWDHNALDNADCDDTSPEINPDALEICNGNIDDNCDGIVLAPSEWYPDFDGDGYMADDHLELACSSPGPDYAQDEPFDCNDADSRVGSSGGWVDADNDGAGVFTPSAVCSAWIPTDCNDKNPQINPMATETFNDGVDQDCSGRDADITLAGSTTVAGFAKLTVSSVFSTDDPPGVAGLGSGRIAVGLGGAIYFNPVTVNTARSMDDSPATLRAIDSGFGDKQAYGDGALWIGDTAALWRVKTADISQDGESFLDCGAAECEPLPSCAFTERSLQTNAAVIPGWAVGANAVYHIGDDCAFLAEILLPDAPTAVTAVGDINGDSRPDLAVTMPTHSSQVVVVLNADGLRGTHLLADLATQNIVGLADTSFGAGVAPHGDSNHDGYGEIAVAATYAAVDNGAVYVYNGRSGTDVNLGLLFTWTGPTARNTRFGTSMVSIGDIDGVRGEELAVSAPLTKDGNGTTVGAVYLLGQGAGVSQSVETVGQRYVGVANAPLKASIWRLGDLDGDGREELGVWQTGTAPSIDVIFGNQH